MGVSVRQKDGNWYIFIRHAGQRAAERCNSQEEASMAKELVLERIKNGKFNISEYQRKRVEKPAPVVTSEGKTLRQFYEGTVRPLWDSSLSRNTYKSYDGSFKVHILPAIGDVTLLDLTRDHVKRFVADLRKKGVRQSDEPKEAVIGSTAEPPMTSPPRLLSKETIRNVIAALRSCLNEALEGGLVAGNHAVRLGKFYKNAADYREEIDPFTSDEVSKLLQVTRAQFGFESYVLLLALFHCGLRAGEAAGLEWSDLDAKNKVLLVRRQISRGLKGRPKTRKKRSVDVSTVLLAELQALKRERQAEYFAQGKNEIPDSIFLGAGQIIWEDGKEIGRGPRGHVDMDNWRNRVYWKATTKAEIRRRRLHDTRHTFASILLSNGESLKYVSSQLGHASIRMTADVYGHLEVGSNRAAVDRLPTIGATQTASA